MKPDARDPIAELKQLWQAVQAPAPHRETLDAEDAATQAAVDWMRAASQVVVPSAPDALLQDLRRRAPSQPLAPRTHWWSGLAAAALLAILFGLWHINRADPAREPQQNIAMGPHSSEAETSDPTHSKAPPLSPDRLQRGIDARHRGNSIEMRSGNVRLSFITQKPETL